MSRRPWPYGAVAPSPRSYCEAAWGVCAEEAAVGDVCFQYGWHGDPDSRCAPCASTPAPSEVCAKTPLDVQVVTMTPKAMSMIELAQRLIETPQWLGALFLAPPMYTGWLHRDDEGILWRKFPSTGWFPDLTDDATGGKVLGLLRASTTADIKVLLGLGGEIKASVSVGTMPDPFGGVSLGEAAARALIALAELRSAPGGEG